MGAKGLIKKALKAAPDGTLSMEALQAKIVPLLVEQGKSEGKAKKVVEKKVKEGG